MVAMHTQEPSFILRGVRADGTVVEGIFPATAEGRAELDEKRRGLRVESVEFTGAIPVSAMGQLLDEMDAS